MFERRRARRWARPLQSSAARPGGRSERTPARRDTEMPVFAGDASNPPAGASEPTDRDTPLVASRSDVTGPMTRIARLFGASGSTLAVVTVVALAALPVAAGAAGTASNRAEQDPTAAPVGRATPHRVEAGSATEAISKGTRAVTGAGPARTRLAARAARAADSVAGVAGTRPVPRATRHTAVNHLHPFLVCTRSHESSQAAPAFDDGYRAVSPTGRYRGAYQFSRATWDHAARRYGRPDLIGVDPIDAAVPDQDHLASLLYRAEGARPWMGRCAGL